jgi:hypothetical protein
VTRELRHTHCAIQVPLDWSALATVRRAITRCLEHCRADLRDAATMVACELAENVVEHGERHPSSEGGVLSIMADDHRITVSSVNAVASPQSVDKVSEVLSDIVRARDPHALYLERLKAILENPEHADHHLGLYRVVCEARFDLKHSYQDGLLTISASRDRD